MENIQTRLETLAPQILEKFISELEERYTAPGNSDQIDPQHIDMVRNGNKIPASRDKIELLNRIGQDFRLTPGEIDVVADRIVEV